MIECLTEDRLAELLPINKVVQDLHVRAYPELFRSNPDPHDLLEFFRAACTAEGGAILVDCRPCGIVGYALLSVDTRPGNALLHDQRYGHLQQISVLPEWQRKGVGRGLIRAAVAHFRSQGVQEWRASWWAFNEASAALMTAEGLVPSLQFGRARL